MKSLSENSAPTLIINKIYEIRGQKVMLDFDLAELYKVETKRLNEQVKRNLERFPKDFMFKLTTKEWEYMRSQIVTISDESTGNWSQFATSSKKHRGKTYLPYAFTEHGVTMLASILRSENAVKMNIAIVRAFITLRQLAIQHKDLATQLGQLQQEMYERFGEHDTQLATIYKAIENMLEQKEAEKKSWEERERIGFKK
jgi:ORF6N domain